MRPLFRIEEFTIFRGEDQIHGLVLAFAAYNDVEVIIAVEIDEYGIFGGRGHADVGGRPFLSYLRFSRMEVDTRAKTFLPACHDVGKSVIVQVSKLYAIGALRAVVDDMSRPGLFRNEGGFIAKTMYYGE